MNQQESLKIAVIGGKGFIGTNLVNTIKKEYASILVIDKKDCDLSQDKSIDQLRAILKTKGINTIISLAAIKRQDGDSKDILTANNNITTNICKSIQDLDCQVIYYSSCAVYGEKNDQFEVDEQGEIRPTSHYGEHKAMSEDIYLNQIENNKLLIIRPPLIYSWAQNEGYQPGGFLANAKKYGQIHLWGDGREKREFIHVQDAAEVTKLLIKRECYGKVIMASSNSYSYRSIAEDIQETTNCHLIEKQRTGNKVNHSYVNKQLEKMIGHYKFRTPFIGTSRQESNLGDNIFES